MVPVAVVSVAPGQAGYNQGRAEEFYRLVAERAATVPGVRSTTWSSTVPLTGGFSRTVVPEGKDPEDATSRRFAITHVVTPGYFETIGIRLLRGRDFTAADRAGSVPVAVVNEVHQDGSGTSYEGAAAGRDTVYAPLLFKNANGWATGVQIQNVGEASTQELEAALGGTILKEFKLRLERIGIEYQSPVRAA